MVRINDGVIPWWLFDANARPAGTSAMDFIKLAALAIPANKPIGEVIDCSGPAYRPLPSAADARRAQHRSERGLGGARGAHHPRDADARRQGAAVR